MLTERQARLQSTIEALEREHTGLTARIEGRLLTDEQLQTIQDFAAKVGRGLELAEADFATRRRLIETLDVWATLTVEDGEKVIYARCMLGEDVLSIASNTTETRGGVSTRIWRWAGNRRG